MGVKSLADLALLKPAYVYVWKHRLAMNPKLASNSQFSCLRLPNASIYRCKQPHTYFHIIFYKNMLIMNLCVTELLRC